MVKNILSNWDKKHLRVDIFAISRFAIIYKISAVKPLFTGTMYFFSLKCNYLQCACYTNNFPQIELEVRMAGKILEKSQVWRVHFWLIDISEVSQKSWMKFNEQIVLLNWISVQSWLLALYKNNYMKCYLCQIVFQMNWSLIKAALYYSQYDWINQIQWINGQSDCN